MGRQVLKNRTWWDVSSLSLHTALMATRGDPSMVQAVRSSQSLVTELLPWIPKEAEVMEFGCGLGINSVAIATHCRKVVGIDTSKGLLRLARNLASGVHNAKFLWYNGGSFPFGSETFDFVFSVGVFERISKSSVQYYLEEVRRVLKADSKAFLYFLSNRALNAEFTQRLGKDSYFYYADVEARSAVCHAGMQVVKVLSWPTAIIVIGRKPQ